MTPQLKEDLKAIAGRELTPLELAHIEAAILRNGFRRETPAAVITSGGNGAAAAATYKCDNQACRWSGPEEALCYVESIRCCPKCECVVRIQAVAVK